MGEFDEVLNSGGSANSFRLGIEVAPLPTHSMSGTRDLLRRAENPSLVSIEWTFGDRPIKPHAPGSDTNNYPTMNEMKFNVYFDTNQEIAQSYSMAIRRHRWNVETRARNDGYSELPPEYLDALAWRVEVDRGSRAEFKEQEQFNDVRGVQFNHYLPIALLSRYDFNIEVATIFVDILIGRGNSPLAISLGVSTGLFRQIWPAVQQAIGDAYSGPDPMTDHEIGSTDVANWIRKQPNTARRRIVRRIQLSRDEIIDYYVNSEDEAYWWLDRSSLPRHLQLGISTIRAEIETIRYLGPLRIQPSPVYPVATSLGSKDVGPSGQWTASVLDEHKNVVIQYVPPSSLPFGGEAPTVVSTKLGDAVDDWMNYLKVATAVHTYDRGSLGHELKVETATSSKPVSLTHVGVGVSQCLPVVVSLLLAPEGSMTLLEQPELHLHPAVQSRLADFLLAMTLTGRQCLVETHSEYLVNRLRLRIAEGKGGDIQDDVSIYFTEIKDGNSCYSAVALNEYGAIENWPEGFFDQSQSDAEALLMAAMKKRSKRGKRAKSD
ncbi:MAG TPA: DUF3696 domain-containing protein [Kribbella sp.]|nr:DUF3696 domain-containing protein [Kribbella sp.]